MGEKRIEGILPNYYVHILDLNTNVTKLEVGPQNLIIQDNHKLVDGPNPFVRIPPGYYCVVQDPIDQSKPLDDGKRFEQRFGITEVRLHGEPFPLYPGESLVDASSPTDFDRAIKPLPVVKADNGVNLRAIFNFTDDQGVARRAGDEWQLRGPLTYIPTANIEVVKFVAPQIITPGHALRLKALQDLTDRSGVHRATGEEWLVRDSGAYLPDVFEEVVKLETANTLTPKVALHLKSLAHFKDQFGKERHLGDEWLVTVEDSEHYIPDVTEEVVRVVNLTVLNSRQFCVVMDAVDKGSGRPRLGYKELRKGPQSFFLRPGEQLEAGIQNVIILEADEALVVTAVDEFDDVLPDGKKVRRSPGESWMVHGPAEYFPPIEVGTPEKRKAIPLNENEGLYVRDIPTGQVRSVLGPQAYLLKSNEVSYEKVLIPLVEDILKNGGAVGDPEVRKLAYFEGARDPVSKTRDKTRVVTYRCPSNCAVQVYNYQHKTARVVFGPDLVVLGPHESFNVLFLSAGKPKKEGALITVCLVLGPDFITDHVVVETSDHARLKIEISMNNYFKVIKGDPASEAKLFAVPDFIGFASREVASRVRGVVAGIPFEQFHKYSADIIRSAVFGKDEAGSVREELLFSSNNLVITNVDVQSIEPIDQNMQDSLSKSVQMAIEIATKSIEMSAQHEAKRTEQKARGELERQKLQNEKEAEMARKTLLELQAVTAAVESTGQAKAEAQAQAEKQLIEGQSAIEIAQLKADAATIEATEHLESQRLGRSAELDFLRKQNELEIAKAKELSGIEVLKLSQVVGALGKGTILKVAKSGPESKIKMLKALGIKNLLITDGHTPVNLYQNPQGSYSAGPAPAVQQSF